MHIGKATKYHTFLEKNYFGVLVDYQGFRFLKYHKNITKISQPISLTPTLSNGEGGVLYPTVAGQTNAYKA